jgi:hypothetical protein
MLARVCMTKVMAQNNFHQIFLRKIQSAILPADRQVWQNELSDARLFGRIKGRM